MRRRLLLPFLLVLSIPVSTSLFCQEQSVSVELPDSPVPQLDRSAAGSGAEAYAHAPNRHGYPTEREESWKALPKDFGHDQKLIWATFPKQMAQGHHWVPVLVTAGGTAGLLYADPHVMNYFRSHVKNLSDLNSTFNSGISAAYIISVPAGLLAAGYVRHDPYQVSTALLCAAAYGDSAIPPLAIKAIARRRRPSEVPPLTPFQNEFFKDSWYKGSSFPSGHATAAFSVATVVAHRYSNHKWVPVLAYGMAITIGLSRISGQEHFPSDVFVGSVIGFTTAEYATLRPR